MHTQAQAGAIEKTTFAVQPGGSHRMVKGIDLVAQHQWLVDLAGDVPIAFVTLRNRDTATTLLGLQILQIFGKFAHQITARNPHRQGDGLQGLWFSNGERDPKQMGLEAGGFDAVMDGGHGAKGVVGLRPEKDSRACRCLVWQALVQFQAQHSPMAFCGSPSLWARDGRVFATPLACCGGLLHRPAPSP